MKKARQPMFSNDAVIIEFDEADGVRDTTRRPLTGAARVEVEKYLQKRAELRKLMKQSKRKKRGAP